MEAIVDLEKFGFPDAVSTTPYKVNDHGDIVGSFVMTPGGAEQAFLYSAAQERFLPIGIPDVTASQALGVTEWADGVVVCGWFKDAAGKVHGFKAKTDGAGNPGPASRMDVAIPGVTRTMLIACDHAGRFVLGQYDAGADRLGFLVTGPEPATIHTIGTTRTLPNDSANDFRWIVGTYHPSGPYDTTANRGFLYEAEDYKKGTFTTIPSAALEPDDMSESHVWGINEKMVMVGELWLSGKQHGFVYRNDKMTTFTHPNGKDGTALYGINNQGLLVGAYYADGVANGFTAHAQHVRAAWLRVPERIMAAFGRRAPEERRV